MAPGAADQSLLPLAYFLVKGYTRGNEAWKMGVINVLPGHRPLAR
jgi:hypothetical protein